MTPDSPASPAPKAKTPVNTRSTLMPMPAAISESNTPARMMAPSRVRSMRSQRTPAITSPKAITNIRYEGTVAPQSVTDPENRSGGGIERMRPPQIHLTRSSNR